MSTWLVNLSGLWCSASARIALEKNDPHAALRWTRRAARTDRYHPPLRDSSGNRLRLNVLADLQLSRQARAAERLAKAARNGSNEELVQALGDLVAAERGDFQAIKRLTANGTDHLPPRAILRAAVRGALFHAEFDWALNLVDEWEQQLPQDSLAAYHRGRIWELIGRLDEADEAYRIALDRNPSFAKAAFRLGMILKAQLQFAKATEVLSRLRDSPYEQIAAIETADCHWQLRRIDVAWSGLQPHLSLSPQQLSEQYLEVEEFVDEDRVALIAAKIQDGRGNFDTAIQYFQRVLEFSHRNFEAQALLVATLRRASRMEEAKVHAAIHERMLAQRRQCVKLRNVVREQPNNMQARMDLAELYFACESLAEAQLEAQAILKLDPELRRAQDLLAKIYAERSRTGADYAP